MGMGYVWYTIGHGRFYDRINIIQQKNQVTLFSFNLKKRKTI